MKLWIFAGLFTAMWAPMAMAAESTIACDVDDTQRSVQQRVDIAPAGPNVADAAKERGGSAVTTARSGGAVVAPRPAETATPTIARTDPPRRRNVTRRIPDADLIVGRGAL
jgi:hypothetical protein